MESTFEERPYPYLDLPRTEMVEFVPSGIRSLLDVGCGRGAFGEAVKSRMQVDVTGVEVDPAAASIAAARCDDVVNGRYPDDLPTGRRFDCIVFNDILEHLVDPWEALKATRAALAPGGVVIASIPNMRYWPVFWRLVIRAEWRYVSDGVLDRTHLRFFTEGSVREMFHESGFVVNRLEPINLVELDRLEKRSRRVLKAILRFRVALGTELRAQQFAVVATACADLGR